MNQNDSYTSGRLKVAVVGAGPAGVYASDILLRQLKEKGEELGLGIDARIDIFEKLPVPFGLVRYGVAPDHPSIKYIAGALEKTLANPALHLYADVEFGKDITLDELEERYDVVLFATGATADRPLEIEGHGLKGVYGAARFVEWYDGYPSAPREWPLEAGQVAVIGGGNVAMDVARILMRRADDLLPTDIPDNVYEGIKGNRARELHMFVRRGPAQAKFAVQELRELEKLPGVQIVVDQDDFDLDEETIEKAGEDKLTRQMLGELYAIRDMSADMEDEGGTDFEGKPADRKYYIHFYQMPAAIIGQDGRVSGIRVEHTRVDPDGNMSGTGEYTEYPVQAVYHAIGYKPAEVAGIPYDFDAYTLANKGGRLYSAPADEGGRPIARLYATGWAKRGPVGLIGSTKSDALETISNMLADLAATPSRGRLAPDRSEDSTDKLLASKGVHPIDFAGWKKVDAYERSEGAKVGRERIKAIDPDHLRHLALD
ncbi:glutamate synthase [Bifidobacterium xylocopae]|uniref:ferredoxin--NADP(+) reductase n=2 Tax=Bifidobacterium xylocopae TaxID=2493119 RepID=A0A366KEQ8_9BIFI|nr:FAD-dependent oxidoreductase [Bifidobacterium xylocopae]RBP99603.1 glutamate synthase [Bifidobacterium xylocopae]